MTEFLATYGVADISKEEALDALAGFLEKYGVSFIRDNDSLAMVGKSKDSLQYYIARFIINEKDNNTIVFDYIIDMVSGLFLSTAIYLQPTNSALQSKMKNLACYVDTRILFNALGFNTDEEKRAAKQLLDMAKEQGASIRCFRITVEEVRRILYDYC